MCPFACMCQQHRERQRLGAGAGYAISPLPSTPLFIALRGLSRNRAQARGAANWLSSLHGLIKPTRSKQRFLSLETWNHTRANVIIMVRLDDQLHGSVVLLQMLNKTSTFTAFILSCSSLQSPCCYITYVLSSFSANEHKLNARSNMMGRAVIYRTCAQFFFPPLLTVFILGVVHSVQDCLDGVLSEKTGYLPDIKSCFQEVDVLYPLFRVNWMTNL